jgi:hypothetical protein
MSLCLSEFIGSSPISRSNNYTLDRRFDQRGCHGFEPHVPLQTMKEIKIWCVDYEVFYKDPAYADKTYIMHQQVIADTRDRARELAEEYLKKAELRFSKLCEPSWTTIDKVILADEKMPFTIQDWDDEARLA